MKLAQTAYDRLGLQICRNVLITTRSYNPVDAEAFGTVDMIDSTVLNDCGVWPDEVHALGKPFASKKPLHLHSAAAGVGYSGL